MDDPGHPLPELVIVPARLGANGPEAETSSTVNRLSLVLPVFSSVESLVAARGRGQPWICLPLAEAQRIATAEGLARVVIDPEETR